MGREFDTEDSISSENYCTMSSAGKKWNSEFDSGRFADTWTSASMLQQSWCALELKGKCLDLLSVCLGICGSQDLFCFLNLFLTLNLRAFLKNGSQQSVKERRRGTFHPVLYLFQLPMVDISDASAPTWTSGILPAHRASSVIVGREHKAGSQACWGRLVSTQILQAFSPTWPYPSGCPLCT